MHGDEHQPRFNPVSNLHLGRYASRRELTRTTSPSPSLAGSIGRLTSSSPLGQLVQSIHPVWSWCHHGIDAVRRWSDERVLFIRKLSRRFVLYRVNLPKPGNFPCAGKSFRMFLVGHGRKPRFLSGRSMPAIARRHRRDFVHDLFG